LEEAGASVELDQATLEQWALVRLKVQYPYEGESLAFTITFPDHYPRFRFEITTDAAYERHQNPVSGALCLMPVATGAWRVQDTVASVLDAQFRRFLSAQPDAEGRLPDERFEAREGEVLSGYFPYAAESALLVDSAWTLTGHAGGELRIGIAIPKRGGPLVRGAVLQVTGPDGTVLAEAHPALARMYTHVVAARWQRIEHPPRSGEPGDLLDGAIKARPELARANYQPVVADSKTHEIDVVGVVFEEELRHRQVGDAWVFVVRARTPTTERQMARGRATPGRTVEPPFNVVALRGGPDDLAARIPELHPLRRRKVVVVGAGGVGAPSALEFAKAQIGRLVIVDPQAIEPGNAVRYPYGIFRSGYSKGRLLRDQIAYDWPYTTVEAAAISIGGVRQPGSSLSDPEVLAQCLEDADLVYDATGEFSVSLLLSDLSKARGLPLVVVSTTEGGWGGRVTIFRPGTDQPCFSCLQHHINDEDDGAAGQPGSLVPPADVQGTVEPVGCTHPTFTGAGFDVAEIALNGVRLAVSALCGENDDSYPPTAGNAAVLRFRDVGGLSIPCQSEVHMLSVHPACESCRQRRSGSQ
jgi:hypothetical protein